MRTIVLTALAIIACSDPTAPSLTGQWGGPDALLSFTGDSGTILYACGAGSIDSGWSLTSGGQWRATGRHASGGGPVPIEGYPSHPARYDGTVRGASLAYTVTLTDLGQVLGPYAVTRGGSGPQNLCLAPQQQP